MALVVVFVCLFVVFYPNILADLAAGLLDSEREWIVSSQQSQEKKKKFLTAELSLLGGPMGHSNIVSQKRQTSAELAALRPSVNLLLENGRSKNSKQFKKYAANVMQLN